MKKVCLSAAVVLVTSFIWYHSLQDARLSASYSGFFVPYLKAMLQCFHQGLSWKEMDHIIRKIAHFTEFMGLGFFLCWWLGVWKKTKGHALGGALLAGLLVAMTDEYIQRFSPGRSSQWSDVELDFFGVCLGALVAVVARWGWHRYRIGTGSGPQ